MTSSQLPWATKDVSFRKVDLVILTTKHQPQGCAQSSSERKSPWLFRVYAWDETTTTQICEDYFINHSVWLPPENVRCLDLACLCSNIRQLMFLCAFLGWSVFVAFYRKKHWYTMYKTLIIFKAFQKSWRFLSFHSSTQKHGCFQITQFGWPFPALSSSHGSLVSSTPPPPPSFGLHEDNMLSYRYFSSESCDLDQVEHLCKPETVLLMEEILRSPVEVGSLSHYLQGFWHRMWCRIFVSISSSIPNNKALLTGFRNHWFPIEKGRLFWHRCLNWQKALRQGGRG